MECTQLESYSEYNWCMLRTDMGHTKLNYDHIQNILNTYSEQTWDTPKYPAHQTNVKMHLCVMCVCVCGTLCLPHFFLPLYSCYPHNLHPLYPAYLYQVSFHAFAHGVIAGDHHDDDDAIAHVPDLHPTFHPRQGCSRCSPDDVSDWDPDFHSVDSRSSEGRTVSEKGDTAASARPWKTAGESLTALSRIVGLALRGRTHHSQHHQILL